VVSAPFQSSHRVIGVHTERSAAVRHNLAVGRKLGQPLLKLIERDRARAIYVAGGDRLGVGGVADVYSYNPATDAWAAMASMPAAHFD